MDYTDWRFWFSAKGRINRRPYFFGGCALACVIEGTKLVPESLLLVYLPLLLAAFYANIVLGIKRCHDRDKAGWFLLLNFVPLVNLWPLIELTFIKGDEGDNRFGADPLAGTPVEETAQGQAA